MFLSLLLGFGSTFGMAARPAKEMRKQAPAQLDHIKHASIFAKHPRKTSRKKRTRFPSSANLQINMKKN